MAVAIRGDEVEVRRVEARTLHELAHHGGHHVTVDGIDDTDDIICVGKAVSAANLPRDAHRLRPFRSRELACHIQAVSRSREIKDHEGSPPSMHCGDIFSRTPAFYTRSSYERDVDRRSLHWCEGYNARVARTSVPHRYNAVTNGDFPHRLLARIVVPVRKANH